ncbi:MAG TPA: hypothetical protein VE684_09320 [Crenalkalicoccus sp.]|nr:hypothetical protein [Crenalkalicoccus sp.]
MPKPVLRPDNKQTPCVDTAAEHTFPASDPPTFAPSEGARAVSAEEMLHGGGPAEAGETVPITRRFADAEAAKLALETLVREGPVDRRAARIREEGGAATLELSAPAADAERLRGLMERTPAR